MRRFIVYFGFAVLVGAVVAWFLSAPKRIDPALIAGLQGNAERGQLVFNIGGCASCHSAPKAKDEERLKLGGGRRFTTPFGTFVAPNISPDPEQGIGGWSELDLANAMMAGVSPGGKHYFPAFPYTSYIRAKPADIVDLRAYLATLPAVDKPSQPHEVGFPFNIRRGMGLWKLLFLTDAPLSAASGDPVLQRGRYLVETLGHCGECHTSRNVIGGIQRDHWLAGAPNPDGKGRIPNITPFGDKFGGWSECDIAYYLESGFTPDFDTTGGSMSDVVDNTALLPDEDRQAIAAYLKSLPPLPTAR